MKVQEILSTILKGGSLTDKLSGADLRPDDLEWGISPAAIVLPEEPTRSGVLSATSAGQTKFAFPKRAELKQATGRGRLLHFFLNHELLAIETMAYTLLKFPDAPLEFKKGVFKTLQDEQRHLGMYLNRMHELGVELGAAPLNLYFWNTLKTMQSPLDFVTRMSLTFEQANLDFALEYAKILEQDTGDEATARLMKEVHDDEVKHVAHGLKWFKLWSDSVSEWEAYRRLLPFPLTPRRARGGAFFAAESRKEAGLSEDFVERLRIAGGSRGRVPDYFFFNPQCEIEKDLSTLPQVLKTKIEDLAPLMVWFTQEDDVLELPRIPALDWQSQVYDLRGQLPEFVSTFSEVDRQPAFEELKPWGWGKSAWQKLEGFRGRTRKPPTFSQTLHSEKLFSKTWWKSELSKQGLATGWVIQSAEQFLEVRKSFQANAQYLAKTAMGTSGRGHLLVDAATPADQFSEGEWVIEPYYDKVIDFSVQYEIKNDGAVKEWEPRFFKTDSRFQYRGSYIGTWGYHSALENEYKTLVAGRAQIAEAHRQVIEILKSVGYIGPLGIDALIYRNAEGGLFIAPIIEVNVRYTMGRVAVELEAALKRRSPQVQGFWEFLGKKDLGKMGVATFAEAKLKLDQKYGKEKVVATTSVDSKETWTVFYS